MQHNVNSLIGYSMEAKDGEIGKVKEFYFDDQTWAIRYLILKTGNWLSGRKVLISPVALIKGECKSGRFPVNLTKEQICSSPDIDTDKPVSHQQEIELYGHYAWQRYGGSGFYAGGSAPFIVDSPPIIDEKIIKQTDNTERSGDALHLRSTERVTGYHVHAIDGAIGHVKDFIIDDQTWQLTYLVIDTNNWIGGEKVLIPVSHIKEVQWENFNVIVDENIASIKNSKVFHESEFTHRENDSAVY